MSEASKASDGALARPYRSVRRQEQARRTRQEILNAAQHEFIASGYAGTTMNAIAQRAQVSGATVEKTFGTKQNVLKHVIDVAIAGDDEPVPVLERPTAAAADSAATAAEFLLLVADLLTSGQQRSARLMVVTSEAASTDPSLRGFAQDRLDQRRSTAGWIVRGVLERAALRSDYDREHAVDVVWLLMEPALFCRLVDDRRWSLSRYGHWFADSVQRLLTDPLAADQGASATAGVNRPGPGDLPTEDHPD